MGAQSEIRRRDTELELKEEEREGRGEEEGREEREERGGKQGWACWLFAVFTHPFIGSRYVNP